MYAGMLKEKKKKKKVRLARKKSIHKQIKMPTRFLTVAIQLSVLDQSTVRKANIKTTARKRSKSLRRKDQKEKKKQPKGKTCVPNVNLRV